MTGRVFEVEGGKVSVADGWQHGAVVDNGDRWDPADLTAVIPTSSPPPHPHPRLRHPLSRMLDGNGRHGARFSPELGQRWRPCE